jgi:hypothetical protein
LETILEIPATIRFWVDLLTILGGMLGATASVMWRLARQSLVTHKTLGDVLEPIGQQVDQHHDRITKLETNIAHLPDAASFSEMREQMIRLGGGIDKITTEIGAVKETMDRIERPLNVMIDQHLKART